jgi:hypothetical protein
MKIMTKAQTLSIMSATVWRTEMLVRDNVQTDNTECDDEGGMEDVRDSEREAQEYTQYSSPSSKVRMRSS